MNELENNFIQKHQTLSMVKYNRLSPTNRILLYGLYQQATIGNVNIPKPYFFKISENNKWHSWKKNENLSLDNAKRHYIIEADEIIKNYDAQMVWSELRNMFRLMK